MMHVILELAVDTVVRVVIAIRYLGVLSADETFSVFIVESGVMGEAESRGLKESSSASVFPNELPVYL